MTFEEWADEQEKYSGHLLGDRARSALRKAWNASRRQLAIEQAERARTVAQRDGEATPEHPVYGMVRESGRMTPRYLLIWDEGWRQGIVCEAVYEPAARWLLALMDGRPYGGHPDGT